MVILTPALNGAIVQQCTGKVIHGRNGHGDGIGDARDQDRNGAAAHCGAVAELARVIVAPALNRAVAEHRAPCRNRHRIADTYNRNRDGTVRCGTITEIAQCVGSPTLNRAVAQQCTSRPGISKQLRWHC